MFVAPEECVDYFEEKLKQESEALGLAHVETYDGKLIMAYPAVVITADPVIYQLIQASNRFSTIFNLSFYVYHENVSIDRSSRTKEDLELCTRLRQFIHKDMTLGRNIVQGWIDSQLPGQLNRVKGAPVIGTRMTWRGESRENLQGG